MQQAIKFHTTDRSLNLPRKTELKKFLASVIKSEKQTLIQLDYIFCSDNYLLQLNRNFLQHNYYTDILTFDLSDGNNKGLFAELYISTDRVKDNSSQHSAYYYEEMIRVMVHGILHLCGYEDKTKEETEIMRAKENEYLEIFRSKVSSLKQKVK